MSSTIDEVVRDRILNRYGNSEGTVAPEAEPEAPEVLFADTAEDAEDTKDNEAVWYSATFTGAPDYLKASGKPDIDISSLVHDRDAWEEAEQQQIPVLDEFYSWQHEALYPLVMSHLTGLKTLTVGPTGSGKTTLHQNLAAVYGQPFYRLSGRGDMESDTILGRVDIHEGTTTFLLGEFTKAFTKGYYCLLDEIWKLPSNINMALQRPLERGGMLQIDDMKGNLKDKQFAPGDSTIIALADNVVGTGDNMDKYSATMIQDGSTLNRVDLILHVGYLPKEQEVEMLTRKYPFLPEAQAQKAVSLANLVRQGFEKEQISAGMSPRNLTAWVELAYKVKDYKDSFKWTMLQRFAEEEERATVAGYWATVYGEAL